jgi:hypothetical protein
MQSCKPVWFRVGVGIMLAMITACNPFASVKTPTPSNPDDTQHITLTLQGVPLAFTKPAGWHIYRETDHVILTEQSEPLNADGSLQGIVVHIWLMDAPPENTTSAALSRILLTPDLTEPLPVTVTPHSFEWSQHDAAYYMLEAQEGYMTLVLAVMLADKSSMVAINISAPQQDTARVKALLPTLFDGFAIGGRELDSAPLGDLWQVADS